MHTTCPSAVDSSPSPTPLQWRRTHPHTRRAVHERGPSNIIASTWLHTRQRSPFATPAHLTYVLEARHPPQRTAPRSSYYLQSVHLYRQLLPHNTQAVDVGATPICGLLSPHSYPRPDQVRTWRHGARRLSHLHHPCPPSLPTHTTTNWLPWMHVAAGLCPRGTRSHATGKHGASPRSQYSPSLPAVLRTTGTLAPACQPLPPGHHTPHSARLLPCHALPTQCTFNRRTLCDTPPPGLHRPLLHARQHRGPLKGLKLPFWLTPAAPMLSTAPAGSTAADCAADPCPATLGAPPRRRYLLPYQSAAALPIHRRLRPFAAVGRPPTPRSPAVRSCCTCTQPPWLPGGWHAGARAPNGWRGRTRRREAAPHPPGPAAPH